MLTDAPLEASRTPDAQYQPEIDLREEGDRVVCALSGNWTTRRVHLVDARMRQIERLGMTGSPSTSPAFAASTPPAPG